MATSAGKSPLGRPPPPTPVRQITRRSDLADRVGDHRAHPGTLDDDVGREAEVGYRPGMVGGTDVVYQLWLGALGDPVEDMDVEPVLDADEGREHADRAGTGISTCRGSQNARALMTPTISHAFATTVVGSSIRRGCRAKDPLW